MTTMNATGGLTASPAVTESTVFTDVPSILTRAKARLIDGAITAGLALLMVGSGWALFLLEGTKALPLFIFTHIVGALMAALYEIVFIAESGQTPGKRLMGIKVVDAQTGRRPSVFSSFIRLLVPTLGAMVAVAGAAVVYLSAAFGGRADQRGWHDRAASTIVVKA